MLILQALLNMAVIVAAAPPTGVTLPFISYGGSSLVASLFGIGVLLSISRYGVENGARATEVGRYAYERVDLGRGDGRSRVPRTGGGASSRGSIAQPNPDLTPAGARPAADRDPLRFLPIQRTPRQQSGMAASGAAATAEEEEVISSASSSRLAGQPVQLLWAGTTGGMEQALVERAGIPFAGISSGQLRITNPVKIVKNLGKMAGGFRQSLALIDRFQPDVCFVTGGYVCGPVAAACSLRKVPILIYLPDMSPGFAIRSLSRSGAAGGGNSAGGGTALRRRGAAGKGRGDGVSGAPGTGRCGTGSPTCQAQAGRNACSGRREAMQHCRCC